MFWGGEVWGQTPPNCTVNVNGNNSPSRSIQNGDVVCISGTRTSGLPVDNLNNTTIVVNSGASFNSNLLNNISSLSAVYNYGSFTLSNDRNGNWTVYNYGAMTFSTNLNSSKTIINYAKLTFPNSSDINFNFSSYGELIANNNLTFQSNATSIIQGTTSIAGTLTLNSSILLGGSLSANHIKLNGQGRIGAINGNQCNTVIANSIYNDGKLSGNYHNYENTGFGLFIQIPTGTSIQGNSNPKIIEQATYGPCYKVLPVEFLYFNTSYQPQNRSALLDWSTAKEWENSHFEIERAVNTVKEWVTIGRVEGSGYSQTPIEYNFTDTELPKSGANIFYRLKQVDFSGKYSYSKTKAIQVDAVDSKSIWVAYPNPSSIGSEISVELLQLNQYQDELISLRLVNMLGEGQSIMLSSPEDISQKVSEWLFTKKAGLYILDIRWGANAQKIKLLRN